jgi:arginine decarboxylase-like protein
MCKTHQLALRLAKNICVVTIEKTYEEGTMAFYCLGIYQKILGSQTKLFVGKFSHCIVVFLTN